LLALIPYSNDFEEPQEKKLNKLKQQTSPVAFQGASLLTPLVLLDSK